MLGKLRPHVISQSYWPQLRAEEIVMENAVPAYWSEALDTFTRSYEKLREDRTLRWLPHLGVLCSALLCSASFSGCVRHDSTRRLEEACYDYYLYAIINLMSLQ